MGNTGETSDAAKHAADDAQNLRRERLVALGELSVQVAHEINGCLAALRLHLSAAEALATGGPAPRGDAREPTTQLRISLDGANACVERIAELVDEIRRFGRPDRAAPERLGLGDVARAALRLMGPQVAQAGRVEVALEETPEVFGHRGRLVQVVLNLLRNAIDALADSDRSYDARRIRISTLSDGARAILRVEDDGPGVPPELRARVFERYFTTKSPERGTGLGLAIAREIVSAHGGELRLEGAPGGGTRVEVRLSVAAPPA